MDMSEYAKFPHRDDNEQARRWRGPLFEDLNKSTIAWRNGEHYEFLEPPRSVTFPICNLCGHIIWDWPHFEELVEEGSICGACFKDEEDYARADGR